MKPTESTADAQLRRDGWEQASILARALGRDRSTITRWCKNKRVVHKRVGGQLWVLVSSVQAHMGLETR